MFQKAGSFFYFDVSFSYHQHSITFTILPSSCHAGFFGIIPMMRDTVWSFVCELTPVYAVMPGTCRYDEPVVRR